MSGLRVEGLTVRFGGLVAVNGVSFEAPMGRATGLIGPNGAGKSTTFNACCGTVRPSAGRVFLDDRDISGESPARRARRGLGRTFQRVELFDRLSVGENVALGLEARLAGDHWVGSLVGRRGHSEAVREARDAALHKCGITHLASRPAGLLSTGQRRLVELARVIAGGYQMLLLDEPSSGLDRAETTAFAEVLRGLTDEEGIGVLLVEHDMFLVRKVCSYLNVLDFGELIEQGPTEQVLASETLKAAYLGVAAAV